MYVNMFLQDDSLSLIDKAAAAQAAKADNQEEYGHLWIKIWEE